MVRRGCNVYGGEGGNVTRTPNGHSLPTWLSTPGPVLFRRHVRASKYEPLVDEAVLLETNPQYAHIRFTNGRESTVSVSDLALRNSFLSGDVVDDNIQKDLTDFTPSNENRKEKEVVTIHKLLLPQKLYLLQVIQILLPLMYCQEFLIYPDDPNGKFVSQRGMKNCEKKRGKMYYTYLLFAFCYCCYIAY